jgi:hypothetical protein
MPPMTSRLDGGVKSVNRRTVQSLSRIVVRDDEQRVWVVSEMDFRKIQRSARVIERAGV